MSIAYWRWVVQSSNLCSLRCEGNAYKSTATTATALGVYRKVDSLIDRTVKNDGFFGE